MKYDPKNAHYVAVTAIVAKKDKFLIIQNSLKDEMFPGRWKVPGGKLESSDYLKRKPDKKETLSPIWYNVAESVVEREIKEEVGIKIKNIKYVTSLVFIRHDKIPAIVISMVAEYASGKPKVSSDLNDFAWVSLREAKKYKLVAGIYREIEMADKLLKGRKIGVWKKK